MATLEVLSVPGSTLPAWPEVVADKGDAKPCILQPSGKKPEVELAPETEVRILIAHGALYRSFAKSINNEVRVAAIKLKLAFGVRQGFAGRTLRVEGTEMEWKTFVKNYYGITPDHFNRVLDVPDPEVLKPAKSAKQKALPDDQGDLDERFEQQEARITELEEENAALERAKAEMVAEHEEELQSTFEDAMAAATADWLDVAVSAMKDFTAQRVKGELSRLLDALHLETKLTVCEVD